MNDDTDSKSTLLGTIAGGAVWTFGGRISKLVLLFLVEVFMARFLGLSSYGGITLAVVAIDVSSVFGGLGLRGGVNRKLPYYEDDPEKARGVLWTAIGGALISSTLIGSGLFLGADIIATRFLNEPEVATLLRIAAVGIPFSVFVGLGITFAKVFTDAKVHITVRQLFLPISRAILVPVLILLTGISGAVIGITTTFIIGAILAMYLGLKQIPFKLTGPRAPMTKELLTFSFPLMLASGTKMILGKTDIILVGAFLATSQVGVYNVAQNIMNIGWLFFYPISFLLTPVLTRLERDGRLTEANRVYQVTVKWMTFLTFPVFLLIFLFPEVVIGVTFGSDAVSGATAVQFLAALVMFDTLMGANGNALLSFGHNKIQFYGNAMTAILNIILNLVFIPRYGIAGAALASAISLGLRNIIYSARLYQCHDVQPFSRALIRSIGATIPMVVVGYVLFRQLFPTTFFTVTGVGILFLLVYVVIIIKTDGVEQEDIDVVNRLEDNVGADIEIVRTIFKRIQTI